MTEMEVINIANEIYGKSTPWHGVQRQRLLMLAKRFVEVEREACARLCDEKELANLYGIKECAAAIRARGAE